MFIPGPKKLPNSDLVHPYTLVADEAFPLKRYILRPYPGKHLDDFKRIFNYRLSRARRVIENTFGILVNRWRLLRQRINADVNNIDLFVKAIVCLHNYANMESEKNKDAMGNKPQQVLLTLIPIKKLGGRCNHYNLSGECQQTEHQSYYTVCETN